MVKLNKVQITLLLITFSILVASWLFFIPVREDGTSKITFTSITFAKGDIDLVRLFLQSAIISVCGFIAMVTAGPIWHFYIDLIRKIQIARKHLKILKYTGITLFATLATVILFIKIQEKSINERISKLTSERDKNLALMSSVTQERRGLIRIVVLTLNSNDNPAAKNYLTRIIGKHQDRLTNQDDFDYLLNADANEDIVAMFFNNLENILKNPNERSSIINIILTTPKVHIHYPKQKRDHQDNVSPSLRREINDFLHSKSKKFETLKKLETLKMNVRNELAFKSMVDYLQIEYTRNLERENKLAAEISQLNHRVNR